MKTVYIETSVVSYLTALPARDLLVAAWQSATLQWWQNRRADFELCTSQLVLDEASSGHPEAAERRRHRLASIPILPITNAVSDLAVSLLKEGALPEKAADDALHLAIAAYHGGGLSAHLELPSSRQRRDETRDAQRLRSSRICLSRNMHSAGIDGRRE